MKTAKEIYMYLLGALIVLGFFGVLGIMFFQNVPIPNKEILLILLGALSAKFADVIGYFFGSSKSSSDKNDMLFNSQPVVAPTEPSKEQV